jgi:hypothetical protein
LRKSNLALILAFLIIFSVVSVATAFGWGIRFKFYFGLLPFDKPGSPSIAMTDEIEGGLVIRVMPDYYTFKLMSFVASVVKEEPSEIVYLGKNGDDFFLNRTTPRLHMGWLNGAKIRIFENRYDVWYLGMWVRDETIYLRIKYREVDTFGKLFLIEDPGLAKKAYDLMVEAWSES